MIDKLTSSKEVVGQRARRAIGVLACTFITTAGGALAMNNLGPTETTIGPATTDIGLKISGKPNEIFGLGGGTEIGLSDMDAHFNTHPIGPSLDGSIRSINLDEIKGVIGPTVTTGQLEQGMRRQISSDLNRLDDQKDEIVVRSLGAFGAGAIGTGLLLEAILWSARSGNRTKLRDILRSNAAYGLVGALSVGAGGTIAAGATFDPSQFTSPEKSGAVASAEILTKSSDTIRISDDRNANTAVAVLSLINSIEAEAKLEEGISRPAFQIILTSDNHSVSPVGLMNGELQHTDIPSVLFDAGDYTNFGSSSENRTIAQWYQQMEAIKKFTVPGNHDTDSSVDALAATPNTQFAAKGELADFNVNGLRVLAIGDPLYTPEHDTTLTDSDVSKLEEVRLLISERITQAVANDEPYDIILTHEDALLDGLDLAGANIIVGHSHKQEHSFEENYWRINPGTTGGAGLRRFQGVMQDNSNLISARSYSVLTFDQSCQLIDVEEISYRANSADDEYSVKKISNPNYDTESDSTRCAA